MPNEQISPLDDERLRERHTQLFGQQSRDWAHQALDILPELLGTIQKILPGGPTLNLSKWKRKRQFRKLCGYLVAYLLDPDTTDLVGLDKILGFVTAQHLGAVLAEDVGHIYHAVDEAVTVLQAKEEDMARYIDYKKQLWELSRLTSTHANEVWATEKQFDAAQSRYTSDQLQWDKLLRKVILAGEPEAQQQTIEAEIVSTLTAIASLVSKVFFDVPANQIGCTYMVAYSNCPELEERCSRHTDAWNTFSLLPKESQSSALNHLSECEEVLIVEQAIVPKHQGFWVPVYHDGDRLLKGAPKAYRSNRPDVVFVRDRYDWPLTPTVERVFDYFNNQDYLCFVSLPVMRNNKPIGVVNIDSPNDTLRLYDTRTLSYLETTTKFLVDELARLWCLSDYISEASNVMKAITDMAAEGTSGVAAVGGDMAMS